VPGGPERGAFRCDAAGWSEVHGKAFETGLRIDPKTGIDVRNERCSRLKTFEASFVRPIDRTALPRVHLTMPDPNKSGGEEGPTIGLPCQSVGIPNPRNPTIENIGVSEMLPNSFDACFDTDVADIKTAMLDEIAELRDRLAFLNSAEVEDVLDIFENGMRALIDHMIPEASVFDGDPN